ncbi:MAG: hypothetical protein K8R74_03460 [Bacteroidales bacterium]|nr:hypothetical protein [Bacteroidales bacterium]
MTRDNKLDKILSGLAYTKLNNNSIEQHNVGYIMGELCEILELHINKSEEKILESILVSDGHIEYIKPPLPIFRLTDTGFEFIDNGGYIKQDIRNKKRKFWKLMKRIALILGIIVSIVIIIKEFIYPSKDTEKGDQIKLETKGNNSPAVVGKEVNINYENGWEDSIKTQTTQQDTFQIEK